MAQIVDDAFRDLAADIERYTKRAAEAGYLEFKQEATKNLYPLLSDLVRAIDERMIETEETLQAIIDDSESSIQPELTAQIISVFALGQQLCELVAPLKFDDVMQARISEIVSAYRIAMPIAQGAVEEFTASASEEDEEDDGDDDPAGGEEVPEDEATGGA